MESEAHKRLDCTRSGDVQIRRHGWGRGEWARDYVTEVWIFVASVNGGSKGEGRPGERLKLREKRVAADLNVSNIYYQRINQKISSEK